MDYILDNDKIQAFADYADKNELFDLFERIVSRLTIEKPADPLQWMIDYLQKPVVPSIIVLGPPSSGTAAICDRVAKAHDAVFVSTSELLENAIEKQTSMGQQAKPFMERGNLVPDQIVLSLLMQRLQDPEVVAKGYVLEGFPRTKEQAIAMQMKGLIPSHFVVIEVPDEVIVKRTVGIRIDPLTKRVYHLVFDPPPRSVAVESRLIQKETNSEPSVRSRLGNYRYNLPSILACFSKTLRKLSYPTGLVGQEEVAIRDVLKFLGTKKRTHAPRQFKIILAGLPGSGKSSVAELIEKNYGFIHVSPQKIILEEVSSNSVWANELKDFVNNPDGVRDTIMTDLIILRLKKKDCVNQGWVLEGFPKNRTQAEELKKHEIIPNRLIWLNAPVEVCRSRLTQRRYDPDTGRVFNLDKLPPGLNPDDAQRWSRRSQDSAEIVSNRIAAAEKLHDDLEQFYGYRKKGRVPTTTVTLQLPPLETDGIMQDIDASGVGEGDGNGNNPCLRKVFELVEEALLHPVPVHLIS